MWPRVASQVVGAGSLGYMDTKCAHRHVLILLRGIVRFHVQGVRATNGEVCGADREWLVVQMRHQPAWLAQLWL